MENKWLSPALVNLEPVKASDMIVENPRQRFNTTRTAVMEQSAAARRLFSTERSCSQTLSKLTLDDVTSAMYPDSPNAVAFCYAFAEYEPQYQPLAEVNVCQTVECETSMRSAVAVD